MSVLALDELLHTVELAILWPMREVEDFGGGVTYGKRSEFFL